MWANFFFVIFPYICISIFVVGHIWRYKHDQFGWTTRTSQLMESKWLAWGSPLFHFGALFVILGHVGGLLIPASWTRFFGLTDHVYHTIAVSFGTLAGVVLTVGLVILVVRRFFYSDRVKVNTSKWDYVIYFLLTAEIFIGMIQTISINIFGAGFEYRGTVSIWFRQLFYLSPDASLMMSAPFLFQLHAIVGILILAVWPFTRLVHVWSVPVAYMARPYIVYRRKFAPDIAPDHVARIEKARSEKARTEKMKR